MKVITAPAGYKEYTDSDYYEGIIVDGVTYTHPTAFWHSLISPWAERNRWKLEAERAEINRRMRCCGFEEI